jgi:lipid A 4'-phosphatase
MVGIALLSLAGMLATIVFVSFPGIDLWAARQFADEGNRFALAGDETLRGINAFISYFSATVVVLAGAGLAFTWRLHRSLFGLSASAYGFVLSAMVVGPGIIANAVFKEHWGRARPRQLAEFGGSADFTPALVIADQCQYNCSFVSGDPSVAFATLAIALLVPTRQRLWIFLSFVFGFAIGLVRMAQGAHFLSDVVFAGVFVGLAVMLLKLIIVDGRWGIAKAAADAVDDAVFAAIRRVRR